MVRELVEIGRLLGEAWEIYSTLSKKERDKINDFHAVNFSLDHCLYNGSQAVEENLDDIEDVLMAILPQTSE